LHIFIFFLEDATKIYIQATMCWSSSAAGIRVEKSGDVRVSESYVTFT
jgi:hypothetical protein